MFYIDSNSSLFEFSTALGTADTENPPALALFFKRSGTNESVNYDVDPGNIIPGINNLTIQDIPTSIFSGTGQYQYIIYDNDDPLNKVELEQGLCIVTTDPITKAEYGTERQRGEYKGYI
jgi:hypothetical protein